MNTCHYVPLGDIHHILYDIVYIIQWKRCVSSMIYWQCRRQYAFALTPRKFGPEVAALQFGWADLTVRCFRQINQWKKNTSTYLFIGFSSFFFTFGQIYQFGETNSFYLMPKYFEIPSKQSIRNLYWVPGWRFYQSPMLRLYLALVMHSDAGCLYKWSLVVLLALLRSRSPPLHPKVWWLAVDHTGNTGTLRYPGEGQQTWAE